MTLPTKSELIEGCKLLSKTIRQMQGDDAPSTKDDIAAKVWMRSYAEEFGSFQNAAIILAARLAAMPVLPIVFPTSPEWLDVDCVMCYEAHPDKTPFNRPFIVCKTCGNKRCPKASQHDLPCTGSNESGQPGSVYQ
jgi:hypothetical protein